MKQWIVFDLGGVLVNINRTWVGAAGTAGVVLPSEIDANFRISDFEALHEFQGGRLTFEAYLDALQDRFELGQSDAKKLHDGILRASYPGTLAFIKTLHENKRGLACLSNTNKSHWDVLTSKITYPDLALLDVMLGSHEVSCDKPSPQIYQILENRIGAAGNAITFFDDSQPNIDTALSLGWNAHLINPDGDTVAQMTSLLGI